MDRVVSYDYPIDNKEVMKMKAIIIKDVTGDEAEVCILNKRDKSTETIKKIITLDLDPYIEEKGVKVMHYTPEQARKLASALILAAEEAEKQ